MKNFLTLLILALTLLMFTASTTAIDNSAPWHWEQVFYQWDSDTESSSMGGTWSTPHAGDYKFVTKATADDELSGHSCTATSSFAGGFSYPGGGSIASVDGNDGFVEDTDTFIYTSVPGSTNFVWDLAIVSGGSGSKGEVYFWIYKKVLNEENK